MRVISFDPGTKNLAVCVLEYDDDDKNPRIVVWATTALDGPGPSGVVSTIDRILGGLEPCEHVEVVIEHQPTKNAKTKRLECYFEMLFTLRGAERVYVQDARLKLNWAATTHHWPRREIPDWSYAVRKKLSVEVSRSWLGDGGGDTTNAHWKEIFEASKKKDDLADSLLQALAYTNMARRVLAVAGGGKKTTKAIVARKPSDKALESGRFTRNGVKWMLIQILGIRDGDAATLEEVLGKRGADVTRLRKSVLKLFGSYDACARECFGK
jgi:hypothetical protein